jgi:hypothetical protein
MNYEDVTYLFEHSKVNCWEFKGEHIEAKSCTPSQIAHPKQLVSSTSIRPFKDSIDIHSSIEGKSQNHNKQLQVAFEEVNP